MARMTWINQPWNDCPVSDSDLPRMFTEGKRKFPYLKDIFDIACSRASDNDIIAYTNADICVRSNICVILACAFQYTDALYAFRRDFRHSMNEPVPDEDISTAEDYPGSDLKAFRVHWWKKWRNEFPDVLLGMEAWDPCMRILMEVTNPKCDVSLRDVIYHERHNSFWERPENRYTLDSQKYNLRLCYEWLISMGRNPSDHAVKWV